MRREFNRNESASKRSHRPRLASLARAWAFVAALTLVVTSAVAVDILPIEWQAGGLSAGNNSAGQAARMTADAAGNLAIVSGPSEGRDLAVTSYTAAGAFRWRSVVSPASGTFAGDWVVAASNGDVLAVGRPLSGASGTPLGITLIRLGPDGTLLWRVDLARTLPSVARLAVDSTGNAYLAFNSLGDRQDIQVHAYDPAGLLLWSQAIATGPMASDVATSLALGPDESDVVVTGDISGGAAWITASYDQSTGNRNWLVTAPEGLAALDVVLDDSRVYVTGQGNVGISGFLTVIAYDRTTGARLWRTDTKPAGAGTAAGLRIALAPDGSLAVTGQALLGFLDWYTVALETTGAVRWEAVRDGGLNTDEIPAGLLVLADGTTVVTGKGGPNLPGGFIPGVTAGYSAAGTPLWEAFSPLATVWAAAPSDGRVCATGGYDAYVACFSPLSTNQVGTVPDGDIVAGIPLRVSRNSGGSLALTWGSSCIATDTDYAIYEGPLERPFTAHVPLLACTTGAATVATLAPSAGSTYYLVVAHDGALEGSHGTDSAGQQRSPGPQQCLPTAAVLACR